MVPAGTHRYSLNFKGIPYKAVWVEYPDIENTLKDLGIAASATKSDGKTPHYTLPAIYDPATKTGLTESLAIAKYLDEKYPDKPILMPKGTEVSGFVIWIRILFGKESEEWKDVSGWHSERWGRMIQVLEKYE
ncbi:hypothetical protein K435DRAFT_868230 [Dendrothele bispora CBS 962.96]|uniref:GST N-terminal domain-containing protein n=1 Tax=Dendrothele bispora (strain CBS 962.96) TaxID=1314807 RepID=A0A4S8LCT0_DENBC|nr:hypothetical protein K435DRAFT_868230 [Dendrothele bispora CBS 962.96]